MILFVKALEIHTIKNIYKFCEGPCDLVPPFILSLDVDTPPFDISSDVDHRSGNVENINVRY